MKRWLIPALVLSAAAVVLPYVLGCEPKGPDPSLVARLQPETLERMHLVMNKVGQYYRLLETSVGGGHLGDAAMQADAVAALGAYLAPHRDPGMPPEYIALQARFDEAARELSVAARRNSIQDVSRRFSEMRRTCRDCHTTYRVRLGDPYRDLGLTDAR